MSDTVIPEGRGKSEAMKSFLAGGGGLLSRGGDRNPQFRYQKGRLKGKTQEEAESVFETLWAGAAPGVKNKYARRGSPEGVLAPSEMEEVGTGNGGDAPQPGVEYGKRKIPGVSPTPAKAEGELQPVPPAKPGNTAGMTAPSQEMGPPRSAMNPTAAPVTTTANVQKGSTPGRGQLITSGNVADDASRVRAQAAERVTTPSPVPVGAPTMTPSAPKPTAGGSDPGVAPKINRLTGLPFGYRPGDALPSGAGQSVQDAAVASNTRMAEANKAEFGKPRIAGIKPTPTVGFGGREVSPEAQAFVAKTQKEMGAIGAANQRVKDTTGAVNARYGSVNNAPDAVKWGVNPETGAQLDANGVKGLGKKHGQLKGYDPKAGRVLAGR